jgi:uncharacterized protein Usg
LGKVSHVNAFTRIATKDAIKGSQMTDQDLPQHGYRMATAEILYHLPDHPHLLQSYVWQQIDLAPEFPMLRRFLDFWAHNLEGKLHSVKLAHAPLLNACQINHAVASYRLH